MPVNTDGEDDRRLAVVHVPLVSIAQRRAGKIAGEVTGDPASGSPFRTMSSIQASGMICTLSPACLRDQLADAGQIPHGGTETSRTARPAEPVDGDVGAPLGSQWFQISSLIRSAYRRPVARSITHPSRSVFGETWVMSSVELHEIADE